MDTSFLRYFLRLLTLEELINISQCLQILEDETKRIQIVIAKNEVYLLDDRVQSSEELTGKIRAAVGKAKLLLAQKFEQFAGLCRKNLVRTIL